VNGACGGRACATLLLVALASCRFIQPQPQPAASTVQPMPTIPVYEIARAEIDSVLSLAPVRSRDPIDGLGATKLVSLNANNAEARTLLLWLAQEAGVSLVVAPDVTARVSVSFNNVPAGEAMRAIIAEAGLSLIAPGMQSPWPPVVFFQMPIDINRVSAETIVARFGVSLEMAKWIVESRPKP